MTFGEKILMLRKARGMNQEQLAEALGVSRQAVSKWELNEAVPDVGRVVMLSELFGVTTDYLLKSGHSETTDLRTSEPAVPNTPADSDRKWLGMAVTIVSALSLLVIWAVESMRGINYYSDSGFYGSGLTGHLMFDGWFFLFFFGLVLCLVGGIRILKGKSFLLPVFTLSFWREQFVDNDGETYSQETRAFLEEKADKED